MPGLAEFSGDDYFFDHDRHAESNRVAANEWARRLLAGAADVAGCRLASGQRSDVSRKRLGGATWVDRRDARLDHADDCPNRCRAIDDSG